MTKAKKDNRGAPPPEEKGRLATDAQHAQYAICSATLHKQHMWAEPLCEIPATVYFYDKEIENHWPIYKRRPWRC